MAEKSLFFNSVNGDRRYKAEDFSSMFERFISNGVFLSPTTSLKVIPVLNSMKVNVMSGAAFINGRMYINDSTIQLTQPTADGTLKRINRVVVCLNHLNREIKIMLKIGTLSENPIAPAIQRDSDIYEIAIADIRIENGITQITEANIIDLRSDEVLCGNVNNLFKALDVEAKYVRMDDINNNYVKKDLESALSELRSPLNMVKKDKDSNGFYQTVEYMRPNGVIEKRSVLSNPNSSGFYQIQTITKFNEVGSQVKQVKYNLSYDSDGNVIGETLI